MSKEDKVRWALGQLEILSAKAFMAKQSKNSDNPAGMKRMGVELTPDDKLAEESTKLMGMGKYMLSLLARDTKKGMPPAIFTRLASDYIEATAGSYGEQVAYLKKLGVVSMMSMLMYGEGEDLPPPQSPKLEREQYVKALETFSQGNYRDTQTHYQRLVARVGELDATTKEKVKQFAESIQTSAFFLVSADFTKN